MSVRRLLLTTSLLGFVFVSACTTTSHGEPRPATETSMSDSTSTPSESNDEDLPFAGAPKVDDPLDTSRFEKDPCQALTADQAESLNLPAKGTLNDKVTLGIGCDWRNPETRGEVKINFIVDDPRGISPEYDAAEQGKWAYFDELPPIDGYPAIARDAVDDRDTGYCIVVVGVADDMAFESIVQLSGANVREKDPCDVAADVAGLALETMKAGA